MRLILIFVFTLNLFYGNAWGDESKPSGVFVNFIQFEGNTLLDHDTLARRVPIGEGTILSREFMRLFAEEIRGYYSSQGFHHVIVHPDYRVRDGIFTIKIYENQERPENPQKAYREVQRMMARDNVDLDFDAVKTAVRQVMLAYQKDERILAEKILRQRENILLYNSLQLKEQRERVLAIMALRERIQDQMNMLIVRMRENATRRLEQMNIIQSYLDSHKEDDLTLPYLDTRQEAKFLP
ncbi:MAG: hypothetical protein COV66_13195 [Nitrospinae bacterium CG11_big_fil_rev_8_21_14_0_20_45_15]|nr:MAG: hypothetical protein COV66_13195 [Nitrospinae bacterium CG11_big_fil_rev_8_21_14_0_20_45_15]